mmetsp:Transcript_4288/g.7923  ORF Transcript_4288/g.7923 Transcript_4288/m.7923 type:complete len:233 (+) Transcript_4288:92-790(+)
MTSLWLICSELESGAEPEHMALSRAGSPSGSAVGSASSCVRSFGICSALVRKLYSFRFKPDCISTGDALLGSFLCLEPPSMVVMGHSSRQCRRDPAWPTTLSKLAFISAATDARSSSHVSYGASLPNTSCRCAATSFARANPSPALAGAGGDVDAGVDAGAEVDAGGCADVDADVDAGAEVDAGGCADATADVGKTGRGWSVPWDGEPELGSVAAGAGAKASDPTCLNLAST